MNPARSLDQPLVTPGYRVVGLSGGTPANPTPIGGWAGGMPGAKGGALSRNLNS